MPLGSCFQSRSKRRSSLDVNRRSILESRRTDRSIALRIDSEMTQVYGSFTRRCLARLIDFAVVLAICGSLYLVNRSLGFPVKYSSLFYYYPPESFAMFMNSDLPGVLTTFVCIKLLI